MASSPADKQRRYRRRKALGLTVVTVGVRLEVLRRRLVQADRLAPDCGNDELVQALEELIDDAVTM